MKVLAITGAAHGIGRARAELFAERGYAVSSLDPENDERVSRGELRLRGDVANEGDVRKWLARTVESFGAPSVLVNNAGVERNVPFFELDPDDFDRVVAVNLRGTFLCSQFAARAMRDARIPGCIVNIASTRAFQSEPNTEAYTASKGGIVALTHGMAMSLAHLGIRVNCICPGWIETRKAPVGSPDDGKQIPVGRVGQPTDVAEACLFLAERAPFMNGEKLILDGGMAVKMTYEE